MNYLPLLAAYALGAISMGVFVLSRMYWRATDPKVPQARVLPMSGQIPEQIRGGGQIREPDLADVGGITDRGVNYAFMGLTGYEE